MNTIKIRIVGPANSGKSIIAREIVEHLKRKGLNAITVDETVDIDSGGLYAIAPMTRLEISELVPRVVK